MIQWMLWATLTTGLLAGAALLVERLLRAGGFEGRWAWVTAMAGAASLQVVKSPLWPGPAGRATSSGIDATSIATEGTTGLDVLQMLMTAALDAPLDAVSALPAWLQTGSLVAWGAASVGLAVAVVGGLARLRRKTATWPKRHISGEDVLISDGFGPALVGVLTPEIVLPRALLRRGPGAARIACIHEAEHRRAGDPWLLIGSAAAVVALPWNAALWWMALRLRRAIELDCDRRVLRSGVDRTSYGTLLLALGAAEAKAPVPVPGFAHPTSLLERRLIMMTNGVRIGGRIGATTTVVATALLLAAACATEAPTDTTVQVREASAVEEPEMEGSEIKVPPGLVDSELPLIYVDGVRIHPDESQEALDELYPEQIESIEVIRGGAAERLYGAEAANGIIQIETKGS